MNYEKLIGKPVVVIKAGSQRGMESFFLKTEGILETVEHNYIRIARTDMIDPIRSEPVYTCYTFSDFLTGRYRFFAKDEFNRLTKAELEAIQSVQR